MAADRGCARVVVLTSRCMGAVMVLEKRLEHVTAPIHREVRCFFLLRTWWRGASTRAVADVDSSSNSRSGIEPSGSLCAPCAASATPSASATSLPPLAVANGAFGASSLTARPKWLHRYAISVEKYTSGRGLVFFGITFLTETSTDKKSWNSHQLRLGISPPARFGGPIARCDVTPVPGSLPLGR